MRRVFALMQWMLSPRALWLRATVALGLVAITPLAYFRGALDGRSSQSAIQAGQVALEQKLMDLIVERYPQATIRDFAGFPRVLLSVAHEADLDFRLLLAVVEKESGFKPDAVGKSGEIGLMQLMPPTAELVVKKLGLEYTPPTPAKSGGYTALGSLADPKFNIRVGTAYLRWQIDRYGLNATALRAYNRHPDRALEDRPADRYAEDIGLRYVVLAHAIPSR